MTLWSILLALGALSKEESLVLNLRLNPQSIETTDQYPDTSDLIKGVLLRVKQITGDNFGSAEMHFENGARLLSSHEKAEFFDRSGELVGNILFSSPHRNLKKKLPPPPVPEPDVAINIPPPVQGDFRAFPSEMYCRYGCGNLMGVTFPYYYRPFFGYGYPLLGTESQFPAGYGGNPLTSLGSSGALATAGGTYPTAGSYTTGPFGY
ncbi:hypothetical protein GNI_134720 [Gregarina niphandrodes]|uniref:Transmembrane protein n=1 Tax=Gregarina niphandrodes TaxID=110365 RepID=A0A023B138_GRENI|nr:hypothetical protein GNI_134720 [Gregarina niphandrodes]EZG46152.1 hypothetical protein GNI_134720 [Gregarina niphandrodes]|eukprot:XP_011132348.1 hypothetical protein GNI_134720 [Gregarina niphandrodes]